MYHELLPLFSGAARLWHHVLGHNDLHTYNHDQGN